MIKAEWSRFNKYLYKYWKLQVVVISAGILTVPLGLVNPYLTKIIIDKAYGSRDFKLFLTLAVAGGSIFILNGLINCLRNYFSQKIKCQVNSDMMRDIFRHLQALPISALRDKSTGEYMYRVSNDVASVSDFLCDTIPQVVVLFPRLLFILFIVFFLNWKLAMLAGLLTPAGYIGPYLFSRYLRDMALHTVKKLEAIFKNLHESFAHIYLIKALGREGYETERFEENLAKRLHFEFKKARLVSISSFSYSILNKVVGGVVALYGGYQVIKGEMTLGSLSAVMIYLIQLMSITSSIAGFYENAALNSVACQRLRELLDIRPGAQCSHRNIDYHISQGKIEFRNVSFRYRRDTPVLEGINFSMPPCSKVALVGPSGCGKTTLLTLILRLYEPENGSILIDEMDIRDIKISSLKSCIGVALEEPFLWNDTIASNILYGAPDAGEEEMIKAAQVAEAHSFILELPDKYYSILGEGASRISEGQKQRIAIARAVIGRPKILLLDEAMSSLDSEIEDKIVDNIKNEFRNSTVIVVSHRLSTVRKMDMIYFLEAYNKISIGTHSELLAQDRYRELFASQVEETLNKR